MPLISYLQLVRLPNLFTAAADPIAGRLLVGGAIGDVGSWAPLAASSVATYAAGMVLNDVFDLEVDRAERPGRPLPSGRVSATAARALGFGLLALGPCLAALAGVVPLLVSLTLTACVLGYDLGLKRTPIGPFAMGACRALNLALGLAADPSLGGPVGWLAAGSFGLFVVGVTLISRDEARAEGGRTRGVGSGMAVQGVAFLGLVAAACLAHRFPSPTLGRLSFPPPIEGLLVLLLAATFVTLADARALREPTPGRLQAAVKSGVLALVWLDVGLVAAVRGPLAALPVAALWVPAFLIGKRLYST